ncbi:MAG: hypothetical protein II912_01490 [Clostridia bacterium]|nr:hypothetical protein [Clostridia bacterium]MBR5751714.1 hypothetical protein [Clostridia bacterium]
MRKIFAILLCCWLALTLACGIGEDGTETTEPVSAEPEYVFLLTEEEVNANKQAIFAFLTDELGFNYAAACGVIANIAVESRFDPAAVGDYGTSYGLCQWHNKRYDTLISWSEANGMDYTQLETQLWYIKYELENNFSYVNKRMTKNIVDTRRGAYSAGNYWCINYQRPVDKVRRGDVRGELARNLYWYDLAPLAGR